MSDVPNSFVIIDTNAVIQALNEKTKRQPIQQFLKGKKCQIIVCNEVFAELFEPKKPSVGRWPGFTKDIIIKHLTESFGGRILDYTTTGEDKVLAKSLEKKYHVEGLHYPDSILLAIAKIKNGEVITGDASLSNCCSLEKISCFDQNLLVLQTIKVKKKDASEILAKLDTNFSAKELEEDIIWLFQDLLEKFDDWKNSFWIEDEKKLIFETALQRRISSLKSHDSEFEKLLQHKIDSLFFKEFFLKIENGITSYHELLSLLKSKQELKKQNIQSLQDLLDK